MINEGEYSQTSKFEYEEQKIEMEYVHFVNLREEIDDTSSIMPCTTVNLKLYPYSNDIDISDCKFCNSGSLIMSARYKEEIMYLKASLINSNKQSWTINNSIFCGKDKDARHPYLIKNDEKKMLFDRSHPYIDEIWYLIWCSCIFNKDFTLLAVHLETPEVGGIIYVYSAENSILLSQCQIETDKRLHDFKFISSNEAERLLLFYKDTLDVRDPYNLQHDVINDEYISNLFTELLNEKDSTTINILNADFKTLIDEKIYCIPDGYLWIQKVSKKQWIKYLKGKLQDFNQMRILPSKSQIEKILQRLLKENENYEMEETKLYEGSFVKWEVNSKEKEIKAWKFNSNTWEYVDSVKLEDISLKYQKKNTWYIKSIMTHFYICDLLHNDDLAVIASSGLFIWSIWKKDKIRLLYYIIDEDFESFKNLFKNQINLTNLLDKIIKYKKISLPAPDFDFLIYYKKTETENIFFKKFLDELLDDYIEDNILMKLYGQELLKCCLKFQHYSLAERLCNKICNETNLMKLHGGEFLKSFLKPQYYSLAEKLCSRIFKETEKENLLEKIQFLGIFTFSFVELTQFPQLLNRFLSYTLFIHSTNSYEEIKLNKFSSKPYLQNHIQYLQPSFTSNIKRYLQLSFTRNINEKIKHLFTLLISKDSTQVIIQKEIERIFYKEFQVIVLIFPLPKFSSYTLDYNFCKELIFPKPSIFSKHQFPELYKYWCGEALLNFKWNAYGKYYFFAIFIFYLIFMLSFLIVATIEGLSDNIQNLLLIANIIFGVLHLTFEIRQCIFSPLSWITEIWNYFVTKIQNDNWDDDTIEAPFLPKSLLKIIGKAEDKDAIQNLTDEKMIIQKLEETERIIQELKNILEIKVE
ncbi:23528_t:CDS:2 [Cetraspora pellucida]|uniref:23528_t:CDS:1 n=1 Tax=Cetraspora pellucida TaxID=1433469 RepID=A0A9N9C9M0_9GLOM|nr:23528_t:CDS:2 [Cetraspora pellucida]